MKYITSSIRRMWGRNKDVLNYEKVTYYPRKRDHQDPPIKPTKLLMVERVKTLKGQPYWDKEIMEDLHLDHDSIEKIAIVKNTPEVCALLWRIKHLVKITPIKLPEKLPHDILTNRDTYLHENGTLMIFPRADKDRFEATEKFQNNVKKFDNTTMKKYLRLKWLNPMETTAPANQ
ncbi:39S ribosomal protein L30, mitochondrial [Belonocnema kinseyi]|uniref:39S ribosomal protein L30, mitochondrial n=1 Tax=Belonocnema kinseyi TaxID=2817044 RepID=UPI00143CDFB3|nr:39S ribosomal protein L30, mitochondrial [Belonocnema kinseyi]